jgi:4-amino-4-deoxy-L-arabinose transferase-like glycosyltransferase
VVRKADEILFFVLTCFFLCSWLFVFVFFLFDGFFLLWRLRLSLVQSGRKKRRREQARDDLLLEHG